MGLIKSPSDLIFHYNFDTQPYFLSPFLDLHFNAFFSIIRTHTTSYTLSLKLLAHYGLPNIFTINRIGHVKRSPHE